MKPVPTSMQNTVIEIYQYFVVLFRFYFLSFYFVLPAYGRRQQGSVPLIFIHGTDL